MSRKTHTNTTKAEAFPGLMPLMLVAALLFTGGSLQGLQVIAAYDGHERAVRLATQERIRGEGEVRRVMAVALNNGLRERVRERRLLADRTVQVSPGLMFVRPSR